MSSDRLRVLYVHGFASSPNSRKARFFAEKFENLGVKLEILDMAEQNFERLTISGQLALMERVSRSEPVSLIGSSLGGYVASLYAARHSEVAKLVLLAPAFRFHQLWADELGPERLELWRKEGLLPIFHYGEGREVAIGYQLMEDAARYEAFPDFCQPALLFHGNHDPVVPVAYASAFADRHPNVRLLVMDSGHELTDVLDRIWPQARDFLFSSDPQIQC